MVETKERDCLRKFFFLYILFCCNVIIFANHIRRPITKQPNHFFPHGSSDFLKVLLLEKKFPQQLFFLPQSPVLNSPPLTDIPY